MHKIREIREYPPIHVLFSRWKEEKDIVFLDSSLENRLGRYSIIGRLPYQKLVQDGDSFCVNDEKQKMTFENYLRTYLKEHPDSNESGLPIVSGAMGYISYDYGREKENVAARHPKEVDMPDVILCFYDNFIIEDHQEKRFYLVANGQTKEVDTLLDDVENTVAETYTLWKNGQIPGTKDDHSEIRVTPNFTKDDAASYCGKYSYTLRCFLLTSQRQSFSVWRLFKLWGSADRQCVSGAFFADA